MVMLNSNKEIHAPKTRSTAVLVSTLSSYGSWRRGMRAVGAYASISADPATICDGLPCLPLR
jgi:hypothetical protein